MASRPRRARTRPHPRLPAPVARHPWLVVSLALVLASVAFVIATGVRPAYDAYGWLVWGRQAAHLRLDTNAAPSWKPLTFLFTFPYALALGRAALWLWMVTATAAGFAAAVFAGRIAYRLGAPDREHRLAASAGAVFAGVGVLGIEGYWHFILIATADPMIVALCLAAIDCALSRRWAWAWALLVLACLGRPEALPALVAYAIWAWIRVPRLRGGLVAGIAAVPLLWFGIPALTSTSWMAAGKVLSESTTSLPGDKFVAVLRGFVGLYELPMQVAALFAAVLAVVLRLRVWLLILAAAVAWLGVEVGLAYHGWGVTPRYMFEPAALMVVLAGAAVGRVLAADPRRPAPLRWLALAGVLVVVGTLAPQARIRGRLVHNGIVLGRTWARQIHRLHTVIARDGGARRILACGQPVTEVPFQSILAWELDQNVIDVGWEPEAWRALGVPMVLFEPAGAGWQVRVVNPSGPRGPAAARRVRQVTVPQAPAVSTSLASFFTPPRRSTTVTRRATPRSCDRLSVDTPTS
jgi:hypothetical protein